MSLTTDPVTITRVFSALSDETRLKILNMLIKYPDICVSGLADELDMSVSAASQQCKLLELSGVLRRRRMGQKICYQIRDDDQLIRKVMKIINGEEE